MDKTQRGRLAEEYFMQGYCCAQSVAMAFTDLTSLSLEQMKRVSHAFGGGFGRTRGMCGALAACGIILGLVQKESGDIQKDKTELYEKVQQISALFEEKFGSVSCKKLLEGVEDAGEGGAPGERDAHYYASRPCARYVRETAELFADYLQKQHYFS